jgi:hypothetical protein
MKKPLLLFLLIAVGVIQSDAQTNSMNAPTNGMLSFSLGPALPIGEFASKSATDETSGLANIGGLAELSYRRPIAKSRFGWTAILRGRFNNVDKNATLTPFEEQFPGYNWTAKSGRWTTASALLGGYYEQPLTTRFSLSASIALGVADSWSPKQSITGIRDSAGFGPVDIVEANLPSKSAVSFTALAGLDLRYQWKSRWSLLAGIDYTYLKPTFKNVTASLVVGQNFVVRNLPILANATTTYYNSYTRDYTQPMPSLDIKVGICRTL